MSNRDAVAETIIDAQAKLARKLVIAETDIMMIKASLYRDPLVGIVISDDIEVHLDDLVSSLTEALHAWRDTCCEVSNLQAGVVG